MEMTLDKLSDEEIELYRYTISLTGTSEDEKQQTSGNRTFDKYRIIYESYLQILTQSEVEDIKLEALKRLIFLNWYSILEPSCFTGMDYFDETRMGESFRILNNYIIDKKLDREFSWMLSFYSSWDWILLASSEKELTALTSFVKSVDNSVLHLPKPSILENTMNNRGQMGIYWRSYVGE